MDERLRTLEMLHKKYAGVLYHKCVRMLGERSEAEDAVQETFMLAFNALDSFRYGDSHLPWLYRITTNVCLKIIRTRKRKGIVPSEVPDVADPNNASPAQQIEQRRILENIVEQLDERGQEILVAHYLDGLDQGEIAKHLGISRRAVVKRLTVLREKFEHLLVKEGGQ